MRLASLTLSFVLVATASTALATAAVPISLAAYEGKYPFQKIGTHKFLTEPAVRRAVTEATWEPVIVREALSEGVSDRIRRNGHFLISSSCRPHSCSDVNWTVVIRLPTGPAAVCYHNQDLMGEEGRWYLKGQPLLRTGNGCEWFEVPPAVLSALQK